MPLTLGIGGTLDEPKGSMSMASSVTSLVTQGVGNNFVSRGVKKTLGGFFGLFKKKEETAEGTLPAGQSEGLPPGDSLPEEAAAEVSVPVADESGL